jgi:hypothetical protein
MEQLLKRLEVERSEIAHTALMPSGSKELYTLGQMSGRYQALTHVIEVITELIAGAEKDDT